MVEIFRKIYFLLANFFDKGPTPVTGSVVFPRKVGMPDWYYVARMEIGVLEIYGAEDNPRILSYQQATSLKATDDETPWCSAFVCWCFEQVGIASTKKANARSWLDWGVALDKPKEGCVVVFRRGSSGWQGHVGFYYGERGSDILLLGGNQNNSVNISRYPKSRVLGYRWPTSSSASEKSVS